jgi:hypothetical protein
MLSISALQDNSRMRGCTDEEYPSEQAKSVAEVVASKESSHLVAPSSQNNFSYSLLFHDLSASWWLSRVDPMSTESATAITPADMQSKYPISPSRSVRPNCNQKVENKDSMSSVIQVQEVIPRVRPQE